MTTGGNAYGQLGHGDTRGRFWLSRVEALRGTCPQSVHAGVDHTAAVCGKTYGACVGGGKMYVWGRGDWGQLGLGNDRSVWWPTAMEGVRVAAPSGKTKFAAYTIDPSLIDDDGVDDDEAEMGGVPSVGGDAF